jgi:hypothetical protein
MLSPDALARLAPWIAALREIGLISPCWTDQLVRETRETRILWVIMPDAEEEETDTVQRAYEALEIFALLAEDQRHNESADLLLAVWPDYGARWLELLPFWRLGGGFRVGCKTCVEMPDSLMVWAQLYQLYVFPQTSEETTARRARLRSAVGDAFSIASAASIAERAVPVHLGICVNGADPADASQILQEALPVVTIQYLINQADRHSAFSPRVVVTDV